MLPSPNKLRTPPHFTTAEFDALHTTSLHDTTLNRLRAWETEWEQCRADVSAVSAGEGHSTDGRPEREPESLLYCNLVVVYD